jgi:hypothetical protein
VIVLSSLPAFGLSGDAAPLPSEVAEGSIRLDDILRELTAHPDVTVAVTIGVVHWREGQVTVSLGGDGAAEVRRVRAGGAQTVEARLDSARLDQLGAEFADAGFTHLRPAEGPRQPGDVPVLLSIRRGADQLYSASLWYGDRYQNPGLDRIIVRAEALAAELGRGGSPAPGGPRNRP